MEQNTLLLEGEKGEVDRALGWKSGKLDSDPKCATLCFGHFALYGPQFPYWTRSGFETGGLLKSIEGLFGRAHTTVGILMSSTFNVFNVFKCFP